MIKSVHHLNTIIDVLLSEISKKITQDETLHTNLNIKTPPINGKTIKTVNTTEIGEIRPNTRMTKNQQNG